MKETNEDKATRIARMALEMFVDVAIENGFPVSDDSATDIVERIMRSRLIASIPERKSNNTSPTT